MPTVMTRSCSSATRAAADIFQVRKYAASTSETRTRKTTSASRALSLTEDPHDGARRTRR